MIAAARRYGRVVSGGSQRVLEDYRKYVAPAWAGEFGKDGDGGIAIVGVVLDDFLLRLQPRLIEGRDFVANGVSERQHDQRLAYEVADEACDDEPNDDGGNPASVLNPTSRQGHQDPPVESEDRPGVGSPDHRCEPNWEMEHLDGEVRHAHERHGHGDEHAVGRGPSQGQLSLRTRLMRDRGDPSLPWRHRP